MSRTIEVQITGNSRDLERAFDRSSRSAKQFGHSAEKSSGVFGGAAGLMKGAALGLAGAVGTGLVIAAKRGFDELMQSQLVSAQTAAALKSTGGAAGVTQGQIENLAGALSRMSGVDDEAIQSGQNLLLTFTSVQNKVGKGNAIFDRATATMLDMSTALGQDMKSSAIQLGKALNDPVKGITALRRVGVSFTEGQRDAIKAMVESGNVMGAQKLILAELSKEFGGSAKAAGDTLPGQLNKLKNAFDEAAGGLAAKLLPYLTRLVDWTTQHLPEIEAGFRTAFAAISNAFDTVRPIIDTFIQQIQGFVKIIDGLIHGDFSKVWDGIKDIVGGAINRAIETVKLLGGLMLAAATKLGEMALEGIKAGIAGFAEWVDGRAKAAIAFVTGALGSALAEATSFGKNILDGLKAGILGFANWVGERVTGAIEAITGAFGTALTAATSFGGKILSGLKAGIEGFANWVAERVKGAVSAVSDAFESAFNAATTFGGKILSGMQEGVSGFVSFISGRISAAKTALVNAAKSAFDAAKQFGAAIYNGFVEGVGSIVGFIDGITSKLSALKSFAEEVAGAVAGAVGGGHINIPPGAAGKASGGPVMAGVPYMVGEKGRELFVPGVDGTIIPNGALSAPAAVRGGGGGGGTAVTVIVQGALLGTTVPEVAQTIRREFLRVQTRNGNLGFA